MRVRRHGAARVVLLAALMTCLSLSTALTTTARADDLQADPSGRSPLEQARLDVLVRPILGVGTLAGGAWGEVLVRIQNNGTEPREGKVVAGGEEVTFGGGDWSRTEASYAVGVGTQVTLRLPIRVNDFQTPHVALFDAAGQQLYEIDLPHGDPTRPVLVDVSQTSVLRSAIDGWTVGARYNPWQVAYRGVVMPGSSTTDDLAVREPIYDSVTGDPVLPHHLAGYSRIAAIVMRSDELVRLDAAALEALTGWVLAGGTLAVIEGRPEDLRHPVLAALVGGEARRRQAPHAETLGALTLPPSGTSGRSPRAGDPLETAVQTSLVGYEGGNLHGSLYGSSATYGLGEVHLLAFDAQRPPAVDSGWVQTRMVDLVRRATERTSSVVFRPGDGHGPVDEVRRNLDPNESSRWSIILSALILCLYAVIAGPVNFAIWRRRGRPLRALGWLPVIAGLTFGSVVVVGVAAKGCSGRARHLTVIEAGAGMTKGTARRWRGLFTPQAESLSVVARGETHTLGIAMTSITDAPHDELVIDRDGMRLEKVTVRPWKTLVIREDGLADLGDGISLTPEAGGAIRVTNRSGRRLRGLVVHNGHGVSFFHDSLDDGASVSTATMTVVSASTAAGYAFSVTRYAPYYIRDELDRAATGLADAWQAVQVAPVVERNWFPDDVPTLLGQLEGGEGTTRDSGLPVDSDRVLVRVVGWGGTP